MPFSSCIHALQSADSGPCAGKRKNDGVVYNFSGMPIWTFSIGQKGKSILVTCKPQRPQSDVKAKQQIHIPH